MVCLEYSHEYWLFAGHFVNVRESGKPKIRPVLNVANKYGAAKKVRKQFFGHVWIIESSCASDDDLNYMKEWKF